MKVNVVTIFSPLGTPIGAGMGGAGRLFVPEFQKQPSFCTFIKKDAFSFFERCLFYIFIKEKLKNTMPHLHIFF